MNAGFNATKAFHGTPSAEGLNDTDLRERLEEWICGGGQTAQIDTQGIHLLTVSPPHKA